MGPETDDRRTARIRRWGGGIALALALVGGGGWLAAGGGDRTPPGGSSGRDARSARPLPAFALRGFDGTTVTNVALSGKPAVINFFASTCVFCIHEMPDFETVHQRIGDRVRFLGVALLDEESAARALARETGVTYRLAFDDTGDLYRALRGIGMPVTVFVHADGSIAAVHNGPLDEPGLERRIDETLPGARAA